MTSIRVIHDGAWGYPGGASRVAKHLAKALNAPITVGHSAKPEFWLEDPDVDADIVFQNQVHGKFSRILPQPVRELRLGQLFRSLTIEEDIIVTSGTTAKWIVPEVGQLHVHYCHVPPPRFYGGGQGTTNSPIQWGVRESGALLDQHYSRFVDMFIANSQWTQDRITKHYGSDAPILHPPVRTEKFHWQPPSEDKYFVMICGRLVDMKRPDLVAEAFNDLEAKLVIVGDGPLRKICEKFNGVTVYSDLSNWAIELLVARAIGGIAFSKGEHCGITPKEIQAAGKPVIVPDGLNLCNHVVDGKTGVRVSASVRGIQTGIARVLETSWDRETIQHVAAEWDQQVFRNQARSLILEAEPEIATNRGAQEMIQ